MKHKHEWMLVNITYRCDGCGKTGRYQSRRIRGTYKYEWVIIATREVQK